MSESSVVMIPRADPALRGGPPGRCRVPGPLLRQDPGRVRLDLQTYFCWCADRGTDVFAMTRSHLELYVRWMEEDRGYAAATTARRLSTVVGSTGSR